VPPGPPISVGNGSYGEHPIEVPPGSRLVFYTDGIYERRGEDPDAGIGRMLDILRINASGSEDDLVAALLGSRPDTTDDGCVLVVGR
jgi:serine phosphatase RsbU (regulator of sigma subunit)